MIRTDGELARALERDDVGQPLALGAVLTDAVAKGDFVGLRMFLDSKTSLAPGGKKGVPSFSVGQVLSWGLRILGVGGGAEQGEDKLAVGDFVVMANVEVSAVALHDCGNTDELFIRRHRKPS